MKSSNIHVSFITKDARECQYLNLRIRTDVTISFSPEEGKFQRYITSSLGGLFPSDHEEIKKLFGVSVPTFEANPALELTEAHEEHLQNVLRILRNEVMKLCGFRIDFVIEVKENEE